MHMDCICIFDFHLRSVLHCVISKLHMKKPKTDSVIFFLSLANSVPEVQRLSFTVWGDRVVRRCRGVLLIRIIVGQGPIVLAVDAGGGYFDIFSQLSLIFSF